MSGDEPHRNIPELTRAARKLLEVGSGADDQGTAEAIQLSSGRSEHDLEREAKEKEHARSERFRDQFELLANIGLTVAFVIGVLFGLAWAWHLLAPAHWHWLSSDQLDHLQNLIAGGVVASLAAEHFRRRLSPK